MFSSFTSFLPSVLQTNGNTHDNHAATSPRPTPNPEEYRQTAEDDIGTKKGGASKAKSANEVSPYLSMIPSNAYLL